MSNAEVSVLGYSVFTIRDSLLSGPDRVPDNVVDRKLDELSPLLAPPLALGTHVDESPLDVGDLERAELILHIEMLRDQGLDLRTDCGPAGFGSDAICTLLGARMCFQPKHLSDELRPDAIAPAELLNHVELDRELCDLHAVLVLRWRTRNRHAIEDYDRLIVDHDRLIVRGIRLLPQRIEPT